jgi:hypothetical protein
MGKAQHQAISCVKYMYEKLQERINVSRAEAKPRGVSQYSERGSTEATAGFLKI